MNLDTRALSGPNPARNPASDFAPVLIQVPALPVRARAPRTYPAGVRGRRRRRLRREVRVAATALLCGVPLTWALLTFAGPGLDRSAHAAADEAGRIAVAVADELPMVTISLEPAAPPPTLDAPPVVLEEIVPDHGAEEAVHAGG